jgi:hypothetical protein
LRDPNLQLPRLLLTLDGFDRIRLYTGDYVWGIIYGDIYTENSYFHIWDIIFSDIIFSHFVHSCTVREDVVDSYVISGGFKAFHRQSLASLRLIIEIDIDIVVEKENDIKETEQPEGSRSAIAIHDNTVEVLVITNLAFGKVLVLVFRFTLKILDLVEAKDIMDTFTSLDLGIIRK